MATATSKGEDRVDHCLFCSGDHKSYSCRVGSAYERKEDSIGKSGKVGFQCENRGSRNGADFGSDLPPSNLKVEIVQKYLEGFQLADSCSKGKDSVLVGADYYHNTVLGGIRRLKGQLVATETIFGWCLIGRDSDVRDVSVSLNIIIEEDLISGLIKKFWELESLDIAENEFSDPSNDSVLQRFESEIEYQNSRYRAFLQIEVDEKNRDVSRFLFNDDPTDGSKSPQIYRFTRVLFGVNSSPFMLAATIKHHLRKYQGIYPETSKFLNNCIYVDDIIGGHQNTEDAYRTSTECLHIFREAGMTLHKWQTNSEELRKLWVKEDMVSEDSSQVVEPSGLPFKVLGVSWNKREDSLYFDVQNLVAFLSSRINLKRCLLQAIRRIFDPVGFLGPFVLRVKLLMQEIWKLSLDWDDDLSECLSLAYILHIFGCFPVPRASSFLLGCSLALLTPALSSRTSPKPSADSVIGLICN
ncbi:hypothetical protein AVEN_210912-1 [Araneus ventricosus]|uniref:Reverse transcriptase domain-containing protein n=1 Tax=Araneus ventricosus TaxID=182803 RepID=A0A4Y2N8F1_ARAVE|nr:hypothetical protein AVEN_210912-1 [Araneus ventricosus]